MLKTPIGIRLFLRLPGFFCSQTKVREAILLSQYHKVGPLSIPMARAIYRLLSAQLPALQKTQQALNVVRSRVVQGEQKEKLGKQEANKNLYEEYFNNYEQLIEVINKCPLDNEWIYSTIGWYNMISFYRLFLKRLLETENEKEIISLTNCMSQMNYSWENPYGLIDQDLFKPNLITTFYKRLGKLRLELSVIRKIETLLPVPINLTKKRFYQTYFNKNIENLLRYLQATNSYTLNDVLWLFNTYIKNMNDSPQGITILEQYLVTQQPSLEPQNMELLMEVYELKGAVNKNVYQMYIRPYILKHKMGSLGDLISMIKFTICSQSKDMGLMRELYELITIKYKGRKLTQSREAYTLHLYTHYLLINHYKIKLPDLLQNELVSFCTQRAEGRDNINAIAKTDSRHSRKKYISPCLTVKSKTGLVREFQATDRSVFEKNFSQKLRQIDLQDYQIHEKPVFCCFELDYVLKHKKRAEYVDVEIEGIQYVFTSGKLIRQRQIRDQILKHYNFNIIHIDYNQFISVRFDQDEKLMSLKLKQ